MLTALVGLFPAFVCAAAALLIAHLAFSAVRPWRRSQYSARDRFRQLRLASMLSWVTGGRSFKRDAPKPPLEKLRGYHDLARDALEHAYQADVAGAKERAIKVYRTAVQALQEGLELPVQGTGLGVLADNVSGWRADMQAWLEQAQARLRALEGGPGAGLDPGPVRPQQRNLAFRQPSPPRQPANARFRRATNSSDGGAGVRGTVQRVAANRHTGQGGGGGAPIAVGGGTAMASGGGAAARDKDEERYRQMILSEALETTAPVKWKDIAGLGLAKQALQEAVILPSLRPDLFTGPLRAPVRGILLYGPPGNGKTMLGKALAHEARARFFAISASSLTSKWVGEGEKLVRMLFRVAREQAPSIVFIDEIDSILGSRGGANEHDAARRLKTEFLVQFDGVATNHDERVVVIGATNRPHEIDDAVRRRLAKRIYIPLPDDRGREEVLRHLLGGQPTALSGRDMASLVRNTAGYSASDLTALCKEAAMGPLRELPAAQLASIKASSLRPLGSRDFAAALSVIKPSVNRDMLQVYDDFTRDFGTAAS